MIHALLPEQAAFQHCSLMHNALWPGQQGPLPFNEAISLFVKASCACALQLQRSPLCISSSKRATSKEPDHILRDDVERQALSEQRRATSCRAGLALC